MIRRHRYSEQRVSVLSKMLDPIAGKYSMHRSLERIAVED